MMMYEADGLGPNLLRLSRDPEDFFYTATSVGKGTRALWLAVGCGEVDVEVPRPSEQFPTDTARNHVP